MNIERAKEIAASDQYVDVHYLGVPVYIQGVDETSGLATIYPRELPDDRQTVPVDALSEEFYEPDLPFV